ncbi:TPA: FadR family transcriptional regulator [Pseudomonas aeruginosa]|uniref:FadR/GntR family transcriptional regulator n=1 Tax=Pseudomonas TaxID=286 RepID=UPI0018D5CC34|nr:FCD domain-containing protein [Pseudomonas putida]MBH3470256.1 FadR family transcriptional regulator [Pseudomonas putida]HBP6163713.1 FadR family transcriptional regulator [Pseudomonas aeruginosa]
MNQLSKMSRLSLLHVSQEGKPEEIARRLTEVIKLGLIGEGEQLPSEYELATHFGVATITLRDALAILRDHGVVDTKRGRNGGSFVLSPREVSDEVLKARLSTMSSLELRDLCDEHVAISATAAGLAARRASNSHHQRLAHFVTALENATTRNDLRRADARFHIEIAVAAQSVRLTHGEMRLQSEMGELHWISTSEVHKSTAIAEHRAILQAVVAGEFNLATALTEAHVKQAIKRLMDMRLALLRLQEGAL